MSEFNSARAHCPVCDRAMWRNYSGKRVVLECVPECGVKMPGGPEDARVYSEVLSGEASIDRYRALVLNAPFDPVSRLEIRHCKGCNEETEMAISRVGENAVTVYSCKCGFYERG